MSSPCTLPATMGGGCQGPYSWLKGLGWRGLVACPRAQLRQDTDLSQVHPTPTTQLHAAAIQEHTRHTLPLPQWVAFKLPQCFMWFIHFCASALSHKVLKDTVNSLALH